MYTACSTYLCNDACECSTVHVCIYALLKCSVNTVFNHCTSSTEVTKCTCEHIQDVHVVIRIVYATCTLHVHYMYITCTGTHVSLFGI